MNQEEAEARAEVKAKELGEREMKTFHQRERMDKTWAWNVRYHRECLKRAQHDITYHSAKLAVALQNKKSEIIPTSSDICA